VLQSKTLFCNNEIYLTEEAKMKRILMKMRASMIAVAFAGIFFVTGALYAADGDLIVNGNFNLLPAGTMVMYGGTTAPSGWLLADGSAVSRTTYATLFVAIATTYGSGDGSTTFNLPDFRGVFPKGAGTTNRVSGKDAVGNPYGGSLGAYSQDTMQGHRHNIYFSPTGGSYAAQWNGGMGTFPQGTQLSAMIAGNPIADLAHGTPRVGYTTEPQSLGVNFIIRY
jgi:microcystin-dependent protein